MYQILSGVKPGINSVKLDCCLFFFMRNLIRSWKKEIKELHKKRDLAIQAFKDIGHQYQQLAKDRELEVYHTQPNVDSAISQDTSLIVLTLMYMNVRNVSVVWPF